MRQDLKQKEDLKKWVAKIGQERMLDSTLEYLEKTGCITANQRSSACRERDFGEKLLMEVVMAMSQSPEGRLELIKLMGAVRQRRNKRKLLKNGRVERKITLSSEANNILERLAKPDVTGFNNSGLVENLLKQALPAYQEQYGLIFNERNKLELEKRIYKEKMEMVNQRIAQKKEKLDVRESEIESWYKLRSLALKLSKNLAVGEEQEIVIKISSRESGDREVEVNVNCGSESLKSRTRKSTEEFILKLLDLIQKR